MLFTNFSSLCAREGYEQAQGETVGGHGEGTGNDARGTGSGRKQRPELAERGRNHEQKQSLRALRRQAEQGEKAEKQRQAAAILATRDLEERKRLLAKAMADSEKEARNQAVEYCFHSIYAAVLLAAQEVARLLGTSAPGGC